MLKKYLTLAQVTFKEYFAYKTNFIFWRLQVFSSFLVFYYLWFAVAKQNNGIGSYRAPELYSYFVIGYLVRALVFSTRTQDLGSEIISGNLSSLLLKPIGIVKYYLSRDIIDKLYNLLFLLFELIIIAIIVHPSLIFPSLENFLAFVVIIISSAILFFLYSLSISLLSFWTEESWSGRFLFGVVFVNLFSGQAIPVDLLPDVFQKVLKLTPFPYLYYYPLRIWLEKESTVNIGIIVANMSFLLICLALLSRLLYFSGLKKFQSYGN